MLVPVFRNGPLASVPASIATSAGLPDRYRLPFVGVLLVVGFGGLALLAYKIRDADPGPASGRPPDSTFDPDEMLEHREAANRYERLLQVANRPETYAVILGTMLLAGVLESVIGWFDGQFWGVLFFAALLFSTNAFLRFVWPYFESFYDRRQPDERDPNSMRFQGFSTDSMILVTLVALMLVGMLTLVVLESKLL